VKKEVYIKNSEVSTEEYKLKKNQKSSLKYYYKNREVLNKKAREKYLTNKETVNEKNIRHYYNNKDKYKKYRKESELRNKEKRSKQKLEYYYQNKTKLSELRKIYYEKNKENIRQKAKSKYNFKKAYVKCKERMERDCIFKFRIRASQLVGKAFRSKGYGKKSKTRQLIGIDYDLFFEHLKSTAVRNYGFYCKSKKYHIDHIIPTCTAKTETDVINLQHYTNLQLLYPEDNMKKGGKLE
jgi:hypothetical protein